MGWLWQNGRLRPEEEAGIDPADRGFLLGDGLFETMHAAGGAVPHLGRHLARLSASAAFLDIPLRHDHAAVDHAVRELLRAQSMNDAAIRLTLSRGAGPRGLMPPDDAAPLLMIRAFPLNRTPSPVRAILAAIPRNERSPASAMKTLGCLDQILCLRAARRAGCDEAIMLNTQGAVACATTANVFIVKDGRICTPDLSSGTLPGITRARLIEALPGVTERALSVAELADADEAFLTNSLTGIRPLVELDGQPIGRGLPGPITSAAAGCLA